MSAEAEAPEPVVKEYGRYRVLDDQAGSWWLYRAAGTCERCQGCGCGEQAEPVELPDLERGQMHVMGWMAAHMNSGILGRLGGVMRRGG